MNPPSYHNVTSFDCNYFSNPGTFEGSKLKPHAFQEARRLRTFLRRRGITTVVYQVKNGSLVEYWVKKVGAPMFVQPIRDRRNATLAPLDMVDPINRSPCRRMARS